VLEIPKEVKPEAKPKKRKPGPGRPEAPPRYDKFESNIFAEKLRLSGAVENRLRDEVTMNLEHIEVLGTRIAELEMQIAWLEKRECGCWWCGLKRRARWYR